VLGAALARVFTVGLGAAGIAWGLFDLPYFVRQAPLNEVARQILAGTSFKMDALVDLLPVAEATEQGWPCRPSAVRAAAILKLRIYEQTFAADDVGLIDQRAKELDDAIRSSLSCAPADAFLWQVMFTIESTRNGFRPEYLEYARMSYRLGAYEGWIALRRCPVLLAVFEQLPPDLAQGVLTDFAEIVSNGFYAEAVAIFAGPGRLQRDLLLRRLEPVPFRQRETFAKYLAAAGFNVSVPGVTLPERMPWQ
jgi:hypothetical protein